MQSEDSTPGKTCAACQQALPLSMYTRQAKARDGLDQQCRTCKRAVAAVYREANREKLRVVQSEWRAAHPERWREIAVKYYEANRGKEQARIAAYMAARPDEYRIMSRAHSAVQTALRHGHLTRPSTCEDCGTDQRAIQAAHRDYSDPLDVRWLCRSCHSRWDWHEPKILGQTPRLA